MYRPTRHSLVLVDNSQSNTYSPQSNTHFQANAITPPTWFANLNISKPSEGEPLLLKVELLFLNSAVQISILNILNFTVLADYTFGSSKTPFNNCC